MLGKLTNKILGKKEAKPYSDIPIFESLDSIGEGFLDHDESQGSGVTERR